MIDLVVRRPNKEPVWSAVIPTGLATNLHFSVDEEGFLQVFGLSRKIAPPWILEGRGRTSG